MNKRLLNILAIFALAIVLVLGGWWVFREVSAPDQVMNAEDTFNLRRVQQTRNTARENIRNFLKGNILDDLNNSQEYRALVEVPVQINMENIGNPEPFKADVPLEE